MKSIAIIDVGCGNLSSIVRMFEETSHGANLIFEPESISDHDIVILPGIGAYDNLIRNLKKSNFYDYLKNAENLHDKKLVGICLGMQVMGKSSEEGVEEGLDLIPGNVKKIPRGEDSVPNIGWNYVLNKREHYSTKHFDENERFYFSHSFYFDCPKENILSVIDYNGLRAAAVANSKGNIFGFQFHPEKSHLFGLNLLKGL